MRPIKLVIEGVNSFTDAQELDFEAVGRGNLFCICGKTGAGKTTIFDSIMLALYGRCGRGNLGEVVNLSRKTARVLFEFSEGGDVYSVERVILRRNEKNAENTLGANGITRELNLCKNGEPVASGGAAAPMIQKIIGLDEGEFKTVYLLEQNEYAEFLKLTPADQSKAVGKIFSLMRFGEISRAASRRQREEETEADKLARAAEELGGATPDAIKTEKSELASLRAKNVATAKEAEARRAELEILAKARDAFISAKSKMETVKLQERQYAAAKLAQSEAERRAEEFSEGAARAEQTAKKLEELRAEQNRLSALNAIDREYKTATDTAAAKKSEYEAAILRARAAETEHGALTEKAERAGHELEAALDATENAVAAASEGSAAVRLALAALRVDDTESRVAALADMRRAFSAELDRLDMLAERLSEGMKKHAQSVKTAEALAAKIQKYGDGLKAVEEQKRLARLAAEAAARALTAAQVSSHAAAVRGELKDGDVCPVCGGVYKTGAGCEDGDVAECKARKTEADAALKTAEQREVEGNKYLDMARADYEREDKTVRALAAEIAETAKKIEELGADKDIHEGILEKIDTAETKSAEYKRARDNMLAHSSETAALAAHADAALAASSEAAAKAEEYRARLGAACGRTEGELARVGGEISAAEREVREFEERRKALAATAAEKRAATESLERALAAARADCPVDLPHFDEEEYRGKKDVLASLTEQYNKRETEIALKDAALKNLNEKSEKLRELGAEKSAHEKRAKVYADIYNITKSNAMLNYVATEYIEDFTAIAGEILGEMSGGKYSMAYDRAGGFVVTDYLNGGKPRRTDTLSGGEMFLASLAVAIAIARAQSKGNNAFFFLDEGFGTLDEDLIDTVYAALETLSQNCLVGVISHSAPLIGLMPACVTVEEATDTVGSKILF